MYEASDKMITLIKDNYSVLQALGSFGINLGFGDMTVSETCCMNGVDTYTFLAVVNFMMNAKGIANRSKPKSDNVGAAEQRGVSKEPGGSLAAGADSGGESASGNVQSSKLNVPTLLHYLKASHTYYLEFQLPFIRRELQESINEGDPLGKLIMKLYEEYAQEIRRHMKYEEKTLFPYVQSLLDGHPLKNYNIETFSKHHEQTDKKLRELKLMIIKYLPADAHRNNQLTATLYDIYNNEEWLRQHAEVEDYIFTPAIKRLEQQTKQDDVSKNISEMVFKGGQDNSEALSDREKEVIIGVVQGLLNKEIADRLCISTNTVITHRRNIARKLQIHSPAGLTIYAIVNGLVDISNVKL